MSNFNRSGSKYLRTVNCFVADQDGAKETKIDVYAVLEAFDVRCPARQHAIKKLLCAGLREKGSEEQDLNEARDAVDRSLQMLFSRNHAAPMILASELSQDEAESLKSYWNDMMRRAPVLSPHPNPGERGV